MQAIVVDLPVSEGNSMRYMMLQETNSQYHTGMETLHEQKERYTPLEKTVPEAVFRNEVFVWAKRLGVQPKEIHIRQMKRKWGSCSSLGRVTFNRELLSKPADFRAEIIVHELLHLKIPNHGPLFKAMLRSYLNKWR